MKAAAQRLGIVRLIVGWVEMTGTGCEGHVSCEGGPVLALSNDKLASEPFETGVSPTRPLISTPKARVSLPNRFVLGHNEEYLP